MDSIKIFWGSDTEFNNHVAHLEDRNTLSDVLSHINKTEFSIDGVESKEKPPLEIDNLVINTDDYGSIKEWALLGFSSNIIQNKKVVIQNMWLNNPPLKIYEDIKKIYSSITECAYTEYPQMSIEKIKEMVDGYGEKVIGQKSVMVQIASALYLLKSQMRKNPVSILFLGESGVGKTETAKFIGECMGDAMVRIQFSMQQTNEAHKFIFGSEHGEDCLARELLRRQSNVILLDEFDKVHPSLYNAFYQMFDEGIFVDANYSVNMEKAIVICTSNYTNEQDAERHLGMPIYSRFSKVIKFNDISNTDRITIASKIYDNLMQKLDADDAKLIADNQILAFYISYINKGRYKNIRMLKNDMEDAINFEILKKLNII